METEKSAEPQNFADGFNRAHDEKAYQRGYDAGFKAGYDKGREDERTATHNPIS